MRPYADGLLGRAELKLKMRRKAKRSRLLSAVGAKSTGAGELDDGIRTGWVCVNLGRVEGGELPDEEAKVQRAEGFVGFGARTGGCGIVVQMMTEEKRGEVDLERLWGGIMGRARRGSEGDSRASGRVGEGVVAEDAESELLEEAANEVAEDAEEELVDKAEREKEGMGVIEASQELERESEEGQMGEVSRRVGSTS